MTKKIYKVDVTWTDGAEVFVKAENESEAHDIALYLVEQGEAKYEVRYDDVEARVGDIDEESAPDAHEIKYAEDNASRMEELEG